MDEVLQLNDNNVLQHQQEEFSDDGGETPEPGEEETEVVTARTTEDGGGEQEVVEVKPVSEFTFDLADVPRDKDKFGWELPKGLAEFFLKYTREHRTDNEMDAWVEDYPVPSNVDCVPALDDAIKGVLRGDGKNATIDADGDLRTIQEKITEILGPLGCAWATYELYMAPNSGVGAPDPTAMHDQLQKAIILLAHAVQKVSWFRRLHVLSSVWSIKNAKELLKREKITKIFEKNESGDLFSKEFNDTIKLEKTSKSNIADFMKTKKEKKGGNKENSAGAATASNSRGKNFVATGSKRPFSSYPSGSGGGTRSYYDKKGGNPFVNKSGYSGRDSRFQGGKYPMVTSGQHALKSNMAAKSRKCTPSDMGDISDKQCDSAPSGKSPKVFAKLEDSDKGSKCAKHRKRVASSSYLDSSSKKDPRGNKNEQSGGGSHGIRDPEHVDQRSHQTSSPQIGSILEQRFCNPQGRGPVPTHHKSEGSQPIRSLSSLQDGGPKRGQASVKERGLDVQNGPEGRIFFGSSALGVPKIRQVSVERSFVRVPLSSLRTGSCSKDFHKVDESTNIDSQKTGNLLGNLPRRSAYNGLIKGGAIVGTRHSYVSVSSFGSHDKHEKISVGALPDNGISGCSGEQQGSDIFSARKEDQEIDFKMSRGAEANKDIPTGTLFSDRHPESHSACCVTGSFTDSISSTNEHRSSSQKTPLRLRDFNVSGGKIGVKMVDRKLEDPGGKPYSSPPSRADDLFRRSKNGGLGGSLSPGFHGGSVECRGKTPEYKPPGADCGGISHKNIHQRLEAIIYPHENRQHLSTLVPLKDGGDEKLGDAGGFQEDMGIPLGAPDHDYCRMDPIPSEYYSRLGVQECKGLVRVETLPQDFSAPVSEVGLSRDGPLCVKDISPTRQVCQLEARPRLRGSGCFRPEVGPVFPICIPAILSNHEVITSDDLTVCKQDGSDRSNMADSTVVPSVTIHVSRHTSFTSTDSTPPVKSRGSGSSSIGRGFSAFSGLVGIRERHQTEGISKEASDLMLHARREGSTKTYESAWKKWSLWCGERSVDPFKCHVKYCLDYLTHLYQSGQTYRSIGVHRSTISAYHEPIILGSALVSMGKHPSISSLMSGIHNLRPPTAKYSFTWDVEVVLDLLRTWVSPLDPKRLTLKLITLLALIGVSRGAELHLFDLNYLADHGDYFLFELPGTIKNGKEGTKAKPVEYHKHLDEVRLCPYSCIKEYIGLTSSWRKEGEPSKFFLSFKAPHKPVSKSTLARWIKDTLLSADIDTKTFQAHSLRGASTSKALLKGLSVKEVVSHGRWSRESTWQKFYHRPVDSASKKYQEGVLKKL